MVVEGRMMCKKCFDCHYGQCLDTKTNSVSCELLNKKVPDTDAETCDNYIPFVEIDKDEDIEVITTFNVHHKCPYCGYEDTIYDADGDGNEILECENCGKKYAVYWNTY